MSSMVQKKGEEKKGAEKKEEKKEEKKKTKRGREEEDEEGKNKEQEKEEKKEEEKKEEEKEEEKKEEEEMSPKEVYFEALDNAIEKYKMLGQMTVRYLPEDPDKEEKEEEGQEEEEEEEEDEEEEEEEDLGNCTVEQLEQMRHILINTARDAALEKASDFVTCGQAEDGMMMLNTRHGNQIISGLPNEIKKILKKKSKVEQFDALFALTSALKEYDYWINDNEESGNGGGCDKALKLLGGAWKKLLVESNETLGVDAEYSRAGIEALLEDFQKHCEECGAESDSDYTFPWN